MNNKTQRKIELGETLVTRGARKAFTDEELAKCYLRHAAGDWGDLPEGDKAANDAGLNPETQDGLQSAYKFPDGRTLWIITELDRSVTTALLPSEY